MGKGKRGRRGARLVSLPLFRSFLSNMPRPARGAVAFFCAMRKERSEERRRVLLSPMTPTLLRPAPPPVGWVYFGRGGF